MTHLRQAKMGLVTQTWAKYADETSLHGIPDIQRAANSIVRLVFWLIVFGCCFGLAIWEIVMVFEDYKASPVITTYDLISEVSLKAPPIQICFNNFINEHRVKQIGVTPVVVNYALTSLSAFSYFLKDFEDYMAATRMKFRRAPLVFGNAALQPNRVKAFEETKKIARSLPKKFKLSDDEILMAFALLEAELAETVTGQATPLTSAHKLLLLYGGNLAAVKAQVEEFVGQQPIDYFELHHSAVVKEYGFADESTKKIDPEAVLNAVSFKTNEVFYVCALEGITPCADFVSRVFDPRMGSCFMLKINRTQPIAGRGVSIHLRLNSHMGWTDIVKRHGGIVVQFHHSFNPIESKNMFNIPPGHKATIRYQMTHYQLNESERYGKCARDMPRKISTYPYSDTTCRNECYLTHIQAKCGCTMYVPTRFRKPGIKYTSCAVIGNMQCPGQAAKEQPTECLRRCKPACEYYDYSPVLSFDTNTNAAMLKHDELSMGLEKALKKQEWREKERIILDLAYGAMEYMKVEQKDAISVHGLISQVGGQLGLFLGASAISFFQIAATFIFCPCHQKSKISNKKETDPEAQIYEHINGQAFNIPHIH